MAELLWNLEMNERRCEELFTELYDGINTLLCFPECYSRCVLVLTVKSVGLF